MNRRRFLETAAATTAAVPAAAQITRTEITNTSEPESDARPNSASVPDAFAINGRFDRVVVMRFKYQTDLLRGIERLVREQNIRHGVFLSALGSVRNYHFHAVANRTFPPRDVYVKDPTGPADLVSMNGYIVDGRVHAHLTLTNGEHAFGGHLEPDTNVFTFAVITVGVFSENVDLSLVDDRTYR